MIAFEVAFDKLAQFETADEIAGFLTEHGIKAYKKMAADCAISRFMKDTTGMTISTNLHYVSNPNEVKRMTPAMMTFVYKFDHGHYPELEA